MFCLARTGLPACRTEPGLPVRSFCGPPRPPPFRASPSPAGRFRQACFRSGTRNSRAPFPRALLSPPFRASVSRRPVPAGLFPARNPDFPDAVSAGLARHGFPGYHVLMSVPFRLGRRPEPAFQARDAAGLAPPCLPGYPVRQSPDIRLRVPAPLPGPRLSGRRFRRPCAARLSGLSCSIGPFSRRLPSPTATPPSRHPPCAAPRTRRLRGFLDPHAGFRAPRSGGAWPFPGGVAGPPGGFGRGEPRVPAQAGLVRGFRRRGPPGPCCRCRVRCPE
jgi:hypothetical protein